MIERPTQILITVLPVLSAGLYLLGLSYYQGYLGVYGIDTSLYPLASDLALFSGLFALMGVSLPAVLYALIALCLFIFAVLAAAVLSSSSRVQALGQSLARRIEKLRPRHPPTLASTALLDKSFLVYGYSTGLIAIFVALLFMAVFSSKRGREQAESELAEFHAGKGWYATVVGEQPSLPASSKLVVCGEHWCSFWLGAESITVRRESIQRILSTQASRASSAASAPMPRPAASSP